MAESSSASGLVRKSSSAFGLDAARVAVSANAMFARLARAAEKRLLPAEAILDGTFLDQLAREHIADFMKVTPNRLAGARLELTWGSICSGGEVVLFVLDSISRAFQALEITLTFTHRFSCERQKPLQDWISGVFEEAGVACGCCFCRAEEMGQDQAWCAKHGRLCDVPGVDILIAGTSCKDFSKASNAQREYKGSGTLVLGLPTSTGGSAETFHGLCCYLARHAVSIVLFENVDTVDELPDDQSQKPLATTTNLEVVVNELEQAGLCVLSLLTDSALFGLPQQRRRYYLLAVKSAGSAHFSFAHIPLSEVFSTVRSFVSVCQRSSPCASELILDQASGHVEAELNRRLAAGTKESTYNVSAYVNQFQGLGLRWGDVELPQRVKDTPWFPTLSHREISVLSYSYAQQPQRTLYRDIGQSPARIRYSKELASGHVLGFCQLPKQVTWVEKEDQPPRLMTSRESLLLSGYPVEKIPWTMANASESLLQGISGSMMASVVPMAVLMSACLALPWRTTEQGLAATSEDVTSAMAAFELATTSKGEDAEDEGNEQEEPQRRKFLRLS